MSETKQQDFWQYAPWVVALVFGYLLWNKQPATPPGPQPEPVQSISKVLDACYAADRLSKIAVLKSIATSDFSTDKAKLEWINTESEKRRAADFKPYVDMVAAAIIAGKTDDLAKKLESRK